MLKKRILNLVLAVLLVVGCAANTTRVGDEPAGSLTSRTWVRDGERWVFYDNGTGVVAIYYEKTGHLSLDQPFLWAVSNRTITIRSADTRGNKFVGTYRMEISHTEFGQDELQLFSDSDSLTIKLMSEPEVN